MGQAISQFIALCHGVLYAGRLDPITKGRTKMQTKVINTYSAAELEGRAKERALAWLREGATDYDWWDSVFEDAKKCAAILGIEIGDIYFSMDVGACFNGRFSYAKGWKKALKAYAPIDAGLLRIGQELQKIQKPFMYGLSGTIDCNDRYKSTKAVFHWSDNTPESIESDLSQAFTDFAGWIYHNLEKQYGWLSSEECLIEDAKANDWCFDSEGRIV